MMSNNRKRVAILGVGQMGRAMGLNLVERGFEVVAYNRTARPDFENLPYRVSSQQSVLAGSEIVVLSLFDYRAIQEVLLPQGELLKEFAPGVTVIDTTTHQPAHAKKLNEALSARGVPYLDAPVSGGVVKARQGTLTLMVGAAMAEFERQHDFLHVLGEKVFHMGEAGAGQAAKMVNQVLVGVAQVAVAEAMTLGRHLQVDLGELIQLIKHSAGDSLMFRRSAPQMKDRRYSSEFQTHLIHKDLCQVADVEQDLHLALPLTTLANEILGAHAESAFRHTDAASVVERYLQTQEKN